MACSADSEKARSKGIASCLPSPALPATQSSAGILSTNLSPPPRLTPPGGNLGAAAPPAPSQGALPPRDPRQPLPLPTAAQRRGAHPPGTPRASLQLRGPRSGWVCVFFIFLGGVSRWGCHPAGQVLCPVPPPPPPKGGRPWMCEDVSHNAPCYLRQAAPPPSEHGAGGGGHTKIPFSPSRMGGGKR